MFFLSKVLSVVEVLINHNIIAVCKIYVMTFQSGDNLKHQNTLNRLQKEARLPIYYSTTPQPNGSGNVWAQWSSPG